MRCLIALCLLLTLFGSPAMAVEEPPYTTVVHDGAYELRDYGPRIVAQVVVPGGQSEAASRGFRLLAGYIFGGNKSRTSIKMTAPVAQTPTAQSSDATSWTVCFFMPAGATLHSLPAPNDSRIELRALPADRIAVLRYSGWATAGGFGAKSAALLAWVRARQLRPAGPVALAQYNPPWTLWFMRRNEIMVPVTR